MIVRALPLAIVVSLSVLAVPATEAQTTSPDLTIRLDQREQRIDGFGVSERVWSDPHLSGAPRSNVPPETQDTVLAALFGDLGLTRMRPLLESGLEVENDNDDPGSLDLGAFDFSGKRTDDHVALVEQARRHGLKVFFPATITFERFMNDANPAEYVEWAMAVLGRWRELGAEPRYFSPVNEPGGRVGRSAAWLVAVVKGLGARLEDEGFRTELVIPDDIDLANAATRATAVLRDPEARRYVAALAYHLYRRVDDRGLQRMATLGARYRVPVWMTEYGSDRYASWPGVLDWAATMHRVLTTGNASAVDFLWGFFGSREAGQTLIALVMDDDGNLVDDSIAPAYWVTGQYSRFVRPGFARVAVDPSAATSPSALVSAFRGPGGRLVVVAVNRDGVEQPLSLAVAGRRALRGSANLTRTSAAENGVALPPAEVRGRSFAVTLAPQSITTVQVRLGS